MATWLPILAILLIAGSFMWLKPSRRDQFLAKLRTEALSEGFRLGSLRVPDTSDFGRVNLRFKIVTLYQLSLELTSHAVCRFTVLRTMGEAGSYLPEGWVWDERDGLSESQYQQLSQLLANLPLSIQVITLDSGTIGLSWDERDAQVHFLQLRTWLKNVAQIAQQKVVGAA